MNLITILIPTYHRPDALAVLLTSLFFQTEQEYEIIISDQSKDNCNEESTSLQAVINLHRSRGTSVTILKNLPTRGLAHQRQFLLDHANNEYCLYLDDDLILESYVIKNLKDVLIKEQCGFTGNAVIGLSYLNDERPYEQAMELWEEKVSPETIEPGTKEWLRYQLHNAANILHVQRHEKFHSESPKPYKIAWVGGCVMYDTRKLRDVGGFSFWKDLPVHHCGEDVLAQLRVMKKHGGCGVFPSGVYHQELETTIPDRRINAPEYLKI
ncbi:glycosyltransferase family 2 protein [Sporocytophaga myxococcoides]|uniref:glycosyltransferase family 2 protein n=1 Tax=Sporocytophaga myxococcoides TaxID=153721 RepID=UPI00040E93E2|nr:glycosyltransferase family A protein [Sporocytophaga myxococcoides]